MTAPILPVDGTYNLQDYEATFRKFSWKHAEDHFVNSGKVNIAYECVDRHVADGFGGKLALHYVHGQIEEKLTFSELKEKIDSVAAVLKKYGVKKGDRVFIFLSKNPDCYIAILAAIKVGAIAGPLFEAFMEQAVFDRMKDCGANVLITAPELAGRVPKEELPDLKTVLVTAEPVDCRSSEISLPEETRKVTVDEDVTEWVDKEDGMIIHYTSGSTGKPKGVLHAHRAMTQQYQTGKWVLDLKDDDVYWCTAHPGWVTGSVYGIFAPWLNRATIVVNGGRFKANEWFKLIERTKTTVWYSAPTAFRMLKADFKKEFNLSSLRHVLSVGEPLNPEVVKWGLESLKLRIHDTWWMTETGAQLIVNLPSQPIKPGSMGKPFPGIHVSILNEEGKPVPAGITGHLAIKAGWPSMMKTIWNNKQKYESYFRFGEWYVSGDLAYQDEEGYVFFQGRSDDMINSSGERIGPFEVESQLIEHSAVAEAAVVGKPDPIRGEMVKAFVVLSEEYRDGDELLGEIRSFVKKNLAVHAAPREIEVVDELPKTQISGKILRRVLKARA